MQEYLENSLVYVMVGEMVVMLDEMLVMVGDMRAGRKVKMQIMGNI